MNKSLLLVGLLFTIGCASTEVKDSWKAPDFQGPIQFQKMVVMAIAKEEVTRRVAEDEFVKVFGADKTVASHPSIPLESLNNKDQVKAQIQALSADGLIIVRPIDIKQEVNYVPGSVSPYYGSPWGYSSMAWGHVYQPGYLATDTIVRLETNIYSVKDEKLIWSGASETFNPGSIKTEAQNLAKVLKNRLKKEKLLP